MVGTVHGNLVEADVMVTLLTKAEGAAHCVRNPASMARLSRGIAGEGKLIGTPVSHRVRQSANCGSAFFSAVHSFGLAKQATC